MLAKLVTGSVERLVAVGRVSSSSIYGGSMVRGAARIAKILSDLGVLLDALGRNELIDATLLKLEFPNLRAWYAMLLCDVGAARYSIAGVRGGLVLRVSSDAADALAKLASFNLKPVKRALAYLVASAVCTPQVRDVVEFLVKGGSPSHPMAKALEAILVEEESGVKHAWACSVSLCEFNEKTASYTLPARRVAKTGILLTLHAATRYTVLPVTLALAGIILLKPSPPSPAEPVSGSLLTKGYRKTLEAIHERPLADIEALSRAVSEGSVNELSRILPEAGEVAKLLCRT